MEIQFFIVTFLQLRAKVEWSTSKNDAFQILGLLDSRSHQCKLVQHENYLTLTCWLLRDIAEKQWLPLNLSKLKFTATLLVVVLAE